MPEPDIPLPDEARLLEVAMAIADGAPVEWPAATPPEDTPGAGVDATGSNIIERLHHLERLVRGHEVLRTRAGRLQDAPPHETLLTEVRRATASRPGEPLRARWGPLIVSEKIGRGSFGDVYRAWDPRLDREVALKLIPESRSTEVDSPVVEEGRLLARVRHPNVLTVYGAERIEGRVGIWTEYVRGETLASEVGRRGPLPCDEAVRIGVDVCAALQAVHAAGLLHRDVKAQNILRDTTGRLVLGDFGTGVALDEHAGVGEPQIAGTPLYLAPELVAHQPASVGSDLYSVGVLLYFLVTGDFPVRGRTFAEIRRAHATGACVPLREARPGLPTTFVDIVEALLARAPDRRYVTAGDVSRALEVCLAEPRGPVPSEPPAGTRRGMRRKAAVASALLVLSLVAIALAVWRVRSSPALGTARLEAGDWIVVGDFENQTGEEMLDGTIEAAVKRELEYSEFVRVAQRGGRVADALRSMNRPLRTRLDRQLAVDVSLRDGGVRALVVGRVRKAGSQYEIDADILDPAGRATIAALTDRATGQSDILAAVRRQTLRLREALGEPASSIDRTRQALERATIPTLTSLHLLARALEMRAVASPSIEEQQRIEQVIREAVEDDPTFAAAAIQLALANIRLSDPNRSDRPRDPNWWAERRNNIMQYSERAFQLAAAATPLERLRIVGHFHHMRTGTPEDPEKVARAASAWEALAALQPDDESVMGLLQNCYRVLGRVRDAAALDLRLADARPRNAEVNSRVANRLLREGNFDGARRYAARAESALPTTASGLYSDGRGNTSARLLGAYISWLEDSPRQVLEALDRVAATSDRLPDAARRELHLDMWGLYAAIGRLRQAERTIDVVRRTDGHDMVETFFEDLAKGQFFAESGDMARLRELAASRWRTPIPGNAPFIVGGRAFLLIEAGFLDDAERDMKWSQALGLPSRATDPAAFNATGTLQLARGQREAAATSFRQAIEMAAQVPNIAIPSQAFAAGQYLFAALNLAAILEADGRRSEAIALLEQAGSGRRDLIAGNDPTWWMRSRAHLARLYRKNNQIHEAEAVEAQMLELLAVADSDYPLLKELTAHRTGTGG